MKDEKAIALRTHPQTRCETMKSISAALRKKGIWVLDRGNDSLSFYRDLCHTLDVRFIPHWLFDPFTGETLLTDASKGEQEGAFSK